MTPSSTIRSLAAACRLAGLSAEHAAALEQGDAATPIDVLDLLAELTAQWEAQLAPPEQSVRELARTGRPLEHDHEAVLRLAREGLTDAEVGGRLGISPATVRTIRRRHGVISEGRPGPRSGWEERLRGLHERGLTTPELVAETGWTIQTVRQRLSVLGLRAHRMPRER